MSSCLRKGVCDPKKDEVCNGYKCILDTSKNVANVHPVLRDPMITCQENHECKSNNCSIVSASTLKTFGLSKPIGVCKDYSSQ